MTVERKLTTPPNGRTEAANVLSSFVEAQLLPEERLRANKKEKL